MPRHQIKCGPADWLRPVPDRLEQHLTEYTRPNHPDAAMLQLALHLLLPLCPPFDDAGAWADGDRALGAIHDWLTSQV